MTTRSGPPPEASSAAPGRAEGEALVLDDPLSLWGGTDPVSGEIIDRRHPQMGMRLGGRVVVMPSGRGSSSSSSVLAESIRNGTAPVAFVLREPDAILVVGSIVAEELYGRGIPIVVAPPDLYASIRSGDVVSVEADAAGGRVIVRPRGSRPPDPG